MLSDYRVLFSYINCVDSQTLSLSLQAAIMSRPYAHAIYICILLVISANASAARQLTATPAAVNMEKLLNAIRWSRGALTQFFY